jgi:RNA polymerase sigma-70 factor (ECF subfamily)
VIGTPGWDAFVGEARMAWPTIAIDEPALAKFVAERIDGDIGVAQADLALAAACVAQDPAAHAAVESVLGEVELAGSATRAPRDLVDEVKQILRVQLLIPREAKPPGIASYRGKGPLRGWVRITATRELIRHKKKQARESPLDDTVPGGRLDELLGERGADPLLSQMKAEYRSEFAVALREAIAKLGAEDRMLLRQQIADGMSIDEIGAAFGVHRATAARWLNRARGALVTATHQCLASRLKLPVDEMASVIRLVQSRLDASMVRYLKEP